MLIRPLRCHLLDNLPYDFFSLLRKSNAFPPSALGFVVAKHLSRRFPIAPGPFGFGPCLTDVSLGKGLQFKERKDVAYLPFLPEHPLCPISPIVRAFLVTPIPANFSGPAFLAPSPSGLPHSSIQNS